MTWDINWATSEGTGKLLKSALNNLRGALEERCDAVGRSIPVDVVTIASDEIIPSNWFSSFQNEITILIPLYVNHTVAGTTFPDWTENDIITEIGDPSRLNAPTDPLVSASWMYQQYNILNLLRWTKSLFQSIKSSEIKSGSDSVAYDPNTAQWDTMYSNALSNYNSASWNSTTTGRSLGATVQQLSVASGGGLSIYNIRSIYTINNPTSIFTTNIDIYIQTVRGRKTVPVAYSDYYAGFSGAVEDERKFYKTINNVPPASSEDILIELSTPTQCLAYAIRPQGRTEISCAVHSNYYLEAVAVCIIKFDNFFQYKDW